MKKKKTSIKDLNTIFFRKFYFSQKIYNYFTKESKSSRKIQALSCLDINYPHQNAEDNIIWATMVAAGRLAFEQGKDINHKSSLALQASKGLADTLVKAKTNNKIDLTEKLIKKKFWIKRKTPFINFEKLYANWLPIAERTLTLSFSYDEKELPKHCTSCAYELIKKMGGTDEDAIIISGLSGGIGLGGGLCGAFVAKEWYEALTYLRQNPNEDHYPYQLQKKLFKEFLNFTNGQYLCPDLSGKKFKNAEYHSAFIEDGGCSKLIEIISDL